MPNNAALGLLSAVRKKREPLRTLRFTEENRWRRRLYRLATDGALACEGSDGVQMADCDGQGIGSVQGFGGDGEIEQPRHHMLDLLLFGAPVADYRRLDGEGRIFGDF